MQDNGLFMMRYGTLINTRIRLNVDREKGSEVSLVSLSDVVNATSFARNRLLSNLTEKTPAPIRYACQFIPTAACLSPTNLAPDNAKALSPKMPASFMPTTIGPVPVSFPEFEFPLSQRDSESYSVSDFTETASRIL